MRDVVGDRDASTFHFDLNQTRPLYEHAKSATLELLFSVCKARWNLLKLSLTFLTRRRCSKYKTVGSLEPLVLHVLNFLDISADYISCIFLHVFVVPLHCLSTW